MGGVRGSKRREASARTHYLTESLVSELNGILEGLFGVSQEVWMPDDIGKQVYGRVLCGFY